MSEQRGYEILSLDELDRYPLGGGPPILMPVRRRLGFRPYGINCWTADNVGECVIERHYERGGDDELYTVLRGRATFTVEDETVEAPAGTLVYVPSGTLREAVAAEAGTVVLAVGAKAGETFEPTGWEEFRVAEALRYAGEIDEARELVETTVERRPDAWQGWFNAACFESLAGEADAAFEHLRRAIGLDNDARTYAQTDTDLEPLRDDPRWAEVVG